MKISVDGGGLGAKEGERFGNYIFSQNLIKALLKYDKKNSYSIYTFEKIKPRFAWSKFRLSLEELKEKKDVFLALNQAIPLYVSGKVISFCHGLSYYFYPYYYSKKDNVRLRKQLNEMLVRSDYIIVSSIRVKEELILTNLNIEKKIVVIPFGIPMDMLNKRSLLSARNDINPYFLYVGMNHPIKNIVFIKKSFNKFKANKRNENYELKIITENCPRDELKNLYRNAKALLTASHYESFNLPVLEALSQGCPVIGLQSAVILELQSYVNLAENDNEFINLMTKIPNKPNQKTKDQLKNKFNWKNYVQKLVELY